MVAVSDVSKINHHNKAVSKIYKSSTKVRKGEFIMIMDLANHIWILSSQANLFFSKMQKHERILGHGMGQVRSP